jgi:DNA-binding transcriptional MerR regulator
VATDAAWGDQLVPIDEVARVFSMRASALRYYEERGLVTPTSRHGGRRWYGPAQVRRVGAIRFWQQSGMLRLDEIAEILDGVPTRTWSEVMDGRIADIEKQIAGLEAARDLLKHVVEHHRDTTPDGCPHYEAIIGTSPPTGH